MSQALLTGTLSTFVSWKEGRVSGPWTVPRQEELFSSDLQLQGSGIPEWAGNPVELSSALKLSHGDRREAHATYQTQKLRKLQDPHGRSPGLP